MFFSLRFLLPRTNASVTALLTCGSPGWHSERDVAVTAFYCVCSLLFACECRWCGLYCFPGCTVPAPTRLSVRLPPSARFRVRVPALWSCWLFCLSVLSVWCITRQSVCCPAGASLYTSHHVHLPSQWLLYTRTREECGIRRIQLSGLCCWRDQCC